MSIHKKLTISLVALATLALPTAANAACADPSVKVTATPTISVEDTAINYAYEFCYNTNGAKYTTQVVEVIGGVDTPRTTKRVVILNGQPGQTSGADTFTPDHAGRYKVIVEFFREGQPDDWETKGEVVVKVNPAPPVVTPDPTPTPTPTPPPVEIKSIPTPVVDPPATPVADVTSAKLAITKKAAKRTVKVGKTALFTIVTKSVGDAAATKTVMCDTLPPRTQYVSSSGPSKGYFKGSRLCFDLGTLKPGQSAKVTVRLSIDRGTSGKVINKAVATASNASSVKDSDYVKVPRSKTKRVSAPVTG